MKSKILAFAPAVGVLALIMAPTLCAQTATWTETGKSDPLHQISFKEFSLQGRFLVPPRQSSLPAPALVLHCQPGQHYLRGLRMYTYGQFVEGWIAVGAVVDSHASQYGTSVSVEYRLDDKKLRSEAWGVSTDLSGIFFSEPPCRDCTISNLLYGHVLTHKEGTSPQVQKIIIGVDEYLGIQIQMQFDLPDSSPVADACGLIAHKR